MQFPTHQISITDKLQSSPLALGTWVFGEDYWGPQAASDSRAIMREAIKAGINHFDTAIAYGNGKSEQLTAQQIQRRQKEQQHAVEPFIASKSILKANLDIKEDLLKSLNRMNRRSIGIYYIHWPKSGVDPAPAIESLNRCKKEGLIKAVGVSNFPLSELERAMEGGPIDIVQCGFNLIWKDPETEILPFCKKKGITFAAYSPLAQGILTGKYPQHPSDLTQKNIKHLVLFREKCWHQLYPALQSLKKELIQMDSPYTMAQLSLSWLIQHPSKPIVITGARNKKQLQENIQSLLIPENHPAVKRMQQFSKEIQPFIPRCSNLFDHQY